MTRGDRIVIALVALAVIVSAPLLSYASGRHAQGVIVDAPGGRSVLTLSRDATYVIEGRRGDVVVKVAGGIARCVAADCPDHICVRSGAVGPGRPVVCAPNGVSISVSSRHARGLDAVSR